METSTIINTSETDKKQRYDDLTLVEDRPLRRASDRILQQANAFIASLEIIGDGIVLIDSNGKVSFTSQAAKTILYKVSEFIFIQNEYLYFKDQANQKRLDFFIEKIREHETSVAVSEVLVINRPNLHRPLIVSLCPLSTTGEEPRLMLIFRDPDMEPTPQWQIFTRHFNLSAQEAKLSLALADGLTLNECSEIFHISLHTTRTHLKSIFAKTETRRQSDLLRLIFTFTRL